MDVKTKRKTVPSPLFGTINDKYEGAYRPELPEVIRILDADYALIPLSEEDQVSPDSDQGIIDFRDRFIRFVESHSTKDTADTIIHECLHGILNAFMYDPERIVDEETLVCMLTRGIVLLMQDNPTLMQTLQTLIDMENKGTPH